MALANASVDDPDISDAGKASIGFYYTTCSTARHHYALINRITTDIEIDSGRYRIIERSITIAVEDR